MLLRCYGLALAGCEDGPGVSAPLQLLWPEPTLARGRLHRARCLNYLFRHRRAVACDLHHRDVAADAGETLGGAVNDWNDVHRNGPPIGRLSKSPISAPKI